MKNLNSILILICIQSNYFEAAFYGQVREYLYTHTHIYIYIYIYIYITK